MTCTTVTRSRLRPLFAPVLLATLACGSDDPTGSISVRYSVGAANDCSILDIQRVRVDIGAGTESAEADCDPSQPIILDGINAGNYPLLVSGIDSMGITVMDNVDMPTDDDNVEIVGGSSREIDVSLAATPATIRARWVINVDGFPQQCEFVLPKTFEVIAYQNSGTSVLLSHQFECAQNGFAAVPDPDRQIDGQDLDAVAIRLLDENDDELTRVTFEFDAPGPGRTVDLELVCEEADGMVTCTGNSSVGGSSGNTTDPTGGDESTGPAAESSSSG
jgi:hypothetical protein